MSKRELKKYLGQLDKPQLEEQFISLYEKFSEVKAYYDFVFNPKEEKLAQEAKMKISNEYFPVKSKRAKLRRSVAQKYIRHFLVMGVDPFVVADLMFYAIEMGQKYSAKREMRYASFYKSMLNSFEKALDFVIANGILYDHKERILDIYKETIRQQWENEHEFARAIEILEN
jgi:hypothetical protein